MRRSSNAARTTILAEHEAAAPRALLEVRVLRSSPARAAHAGRRRAATRSWGFWGGWPWPFGRGAGRRLRASIERASAALDADWSIETTWPALAANTARFLARDYPARSAVGRGGPEPI